MDVGAMQCEGKEPGMCSLEQTHIFWVGKYGLWTYLWKELGRFLCHDFWICSCAANGAHGRSTSAEKSSTAQGASLDNAMGVWWELPVLSVLQVWELHGFVNSLK